MSIVVTRSVFCDGPGTKGEGVCSQWIAETTEDAAAARRFARECGWLVGQPGGQDYCPTCRRIIYPK